MCTDRYGIDAAMPQTGRKKLVRARRWLGRALLFAPGIAIVLLDLALRGARIRTFDELDLVFYGVSSLLGIAMWSCLLTAAARPSGSSRWGARFVLLLFGFLAVGGQIYTYGRYQAYVNHRAVLVGTSFLPSVGQQLWFDRWTVLRTIGPWLLVSIGLPFALVKLAPTRRKARAWLALDLAVVALLIAAFLSPERGAEQGQPPDVMYVSAMGQLARARWDHNPTVDRVHPGPRTPEKVPPIAPHPALPRNVVWVITESVRAQSVCMEHVDDCKFTPFSNEAAPDRMALTQMRALDSTTAISLAVLWSGLGPMESRETLHSAPLLWEYMRAAHLESAYYTSQNLMFGNSGTWLEGTPWDRHVSATMLELDATYETGADDGKLVDYVLADVAHLKEPYVAVVHLSNTHFPYKIDPDFVPFAPQGENEGPETELVGRYQDSIILQDRALGRLVTGLRARPEGSRTAILYMSDHGEQLREKGAVGHTRTLFDPEIRVPFWMDAPHGMLTDAEEQSMRALKSTPTTQIDVLPTVLDLMGVWDVPEMAPFRARMLGQSLLRGGSSTERPLVFSNCTELWACAFRNWGAVAGSRKLIADQGATSWLCYDVAQDPEEVTPLDVRTHCSDLQPVAEKAMGGHPW